ncbi:MAG: hypothetical protein U0325_05245 [Polyangiales bacterium]
MIALSRRGFGALMGALGLRALAARGALRTPYGGALRLPLPAPRSVLDPMRATELADAWPLALTHAGLVTAHPDGGVSFPLLEAPPRREGAAFVLRLREGITASNNAPVDAAAVARCWAAARSSPHGRLALALLAAMNPIEARGARELVVRAGSDEALHEFLAAPALAVTVPQGGGRAGIGAFTATPDAPNTLQRSATCPTGGAYLERVELSPAAARNDELRAFTTGALDASWWGAGLYSVQREATHLTGAPAAAVGLAPTPGGPFASAAVARALEVALAPLSAADAPLRALPVAPARPANASALGAAVASRGGPLRLGRAPGDALLHALAERAVALLDAVRVTAMIVSPDDAPDLTLRAVAPMGRDPWLALASLLAASAAVGGDEAGASAIARTPRAGRGPVAQGVWSRSVIAVLGRLTPSLHLRAELHGARFDGAQLALGDAWMRA